MRKFKAVAVSVDCGDKSAVIVILVTCYLYSARINNIREIMVSVIFECCGFSRLICYNGEIAVGTVSVLDGLAVWIGDLCNAVLGIALKHY